MGNPQTLIKAIKNEQFDNKNKSLPLASLIWHGLLHCTCKGQSSLAPSWSCTPYVAHGRCYEACNALHARNTERAEQFEN
eukprot:114057-Amphidinium_carterae.1